ncbi:MAG: ATP synthase subunit a [Peptostreptococcus russellii]|uniref:ATP synthase subunit a n=1 Tax=Peptostreptococcus russellii TaxID=215200 RepID=A0A2P7PYN7_9FIRM|nr:F0F1 ATP synthase subunit A [Peptostreptococcus russellii]PSJ30822.1 ATP synthase F0 subunit A [Peptostreptococcus russellii]
MDQARYVLYLGNLKISETIVVQWVIMLLLIIAAFIMTRNLKKVPTSKRQHFLEWAVSSLRNLVNETMGETFTSRVPWITSYIGTIMLFFLSSNLVGLLALKSPTTDLDTTVGWALITFFMIYVMGVKFNGPKYFKSLIEPTPLMAPLNIIGELARPISLSFRPFGNILGGTIIMGLVYSLLQYISTLIPHMSIPVGQFLIPVPLHMYFDLFAGSLQAFIFVMLTMVFVSSVVPEEE